MTCRWTGGDLFESSELEGAVVGSRACYRVACEGVSLLRHLFEPPVIEEPEVEDTWVTFNPRNDLSCMVVPVEMETDVYFGFVFNQHKVHWLLSILRLKQDDQSLDDQLKSQLETAFGVSKLLGQQVWMSEREFFEKYGEEKGIDSSS